MTDACAAVVAALRLRLASMRLPIGDELPYQDAVADVLACLGLPFEREHRIRPGLGRVDFYVPSVKLGVELKVKGSPSAVFRQLQRYAKSDEVDALVLVTGRVHLRRMAAEILGKPVTVVATWKGCF